MMLHSSLFSVVWCFLLRHSVYTLCGRLSTSGRIRDPFSQDWKDWKGVGYLRDCRINNEPNLASFLKSAPSPKLQTSHTSSRLVNLMGLTVNRLCAAVRLTTVIPPCCGIIFLYPITANPVVSRCLFELDKSRRHNEQPLTRALIMEFISSLKMMA